MLPALLKYESALRNPQIPPKAIVRMVREAKVTEADVIAARAELAAAVVSEVVSVVETVAEAVADLSPDPKVDAVVEVVSEVAGVVEHGADLLERIATGPRMKPQKAIEFILAVLGVTDADGDGDVDALDALNAVFAAITKRPVRGVTVNAPEPRDRPTDDVYGPARLLKRVRIALEDDDLDDDGDADAKDLLLKVRAVVLAILSPKSKDREQFLALAVRYGGITREYADRLEDVALRALVSACVPDGTPVEPAREPGAAVRALRTERIVDANGRPWRVSFRDVFSGDKADFLMKHHPALVEPFPPKR